MYLFQIIRNYRIVFIATLLFLNISCKLNSAKNASPLVVQGVNTKLDTLILHNYHGDPQLKKLLHEAGKKEKLIIQFLKRGNNQLSLVIWPSLKKNQGVDPAFTQVLQNWHTSSINIANDSILLGDQQIDSTECEYLRTLINVPAYSLIIFMPRIQSNNIIYDLGYTTPADTSSLVSSQILPLPTPIKTDPSPPAKVILPILFLIFVVVNFIFIEPFVNYWFENGILNSKISNNLLSVETFFLLLYCLQYFLYLIKRDEPNFTKLPSFWVVTGLSIFVVTCFPIYLFYGASFWQNHYFVINIWIVQKVAFLIFCVFIAIGFTRVAS